MRLLAKLADASEVQGASGEQTRSLHEVLEKRSTTATEQFVAAVEFYKKSIRLYLCRMNFISTLQHFNIANNMLAATLILQVAIQNFSLRDLTPF